MIIRIALLLLATLSSDFFAAAQSYQVTEAEALLSAQKIEVSINKGDPSVMSSFIYIPEFLNNIKNNPAFKQNPEFLAGFEKNFDLSTLGSQVITSINNGSYKFLRAYHQNGRTHLFFRMFGDAGLNYHDFTLYKISNEVKAADVFVYLTGEPLSTTMATLLADLIPTSNTSKNNSRTDFALQLKELKTKGAWSDLKLLIEKQDPEIKNNRAIQTMYMLACQHADPSGYPDVLEKFAATYPDAANAYLAMIDVYYIKKEVDKGLLAINKVDSLIGGDPFLNFYRGNFYLLGEKLEDANLQFEKAFQHDASFMLNMQQLAMTYAALNQFDKAKAVIEQYKKTAGFKQAAIDELYENIEGLK